MSTKSTNVEPPRRRRHPGSGRGESRRRPKGRQVDPAALEEVRALLGDRPRDRDLLIEHLHLIQDTWHCISAPRLAALAYEMRLPMAEVYEVATFYAHFDVLAEGRGVPAADHGPRLRQSLLRARGRPCPARIASRCPR